MEKLCIIKIRSGLKRTAAIQAVLKNLGLKKLHSCTLMNKSDSTMGMLKVAESVLTYGEIDKETLKNLLLKRARISNSKKYVWEDNKLNAFVDEYFDDKKSLSDIKIKRVFNLHPPIKGFERKGKKAPYSIKGVFGYRGSAINQLIQRMI